MTYFINLLLSLVYFYLARYVKLRSFIDLIIFSTPVLLVWILIVGGQYGVGTDYFSYLKIFNHDLPYLELFKNNGEYIFVFIVEFLNSIGLFGQSIFVIFAIFFAVATFFIMYTTVKKEDYYIFIVIFICISAVFHNQMNGIRQYIAIYLFTISTLFLLNKRYLLWLIYAGISIGIHKSSLYIYFFHIFILINIKFSRKILLFILAAAFVISILDIKEFLVMIMEKFNIYAHYIESQHIENVEFINKLTKYIYIPFIIITIFKKDKFSLTVMQEKLLVFGILAFCIKIAGTSLILLSRFVQYFDILIIFPFVYLCIYFNYNHKKIYRIMILVFFVCIYLIKILIFPNAEYSYQSILFN